MCFGAVNTLASTKFATAFTAAKNAAIELGKKQRFVNAGDVQAELKKLGYTSANLGNAAGSIFSKKLFRTTGQKVKNTNPSAHRRKVTQWEYFGPGAAIVPGANVGPATVSSVNTVSPTTPVYVPATVQNTKVGSSIAIKPSLRVQLTGNGKRPETAVVSEIITNAQKWPLRVKFADGATGRLAYEEVDVVQ